MIARIALWSFFLFGPKSKIINIPPISADTELFPDIVVQGLQDGVSEPLRNIKAYFDPGLDDLPYQGEKFPVLDFPAKESHNHARR